VIEAPEDGLATLTEAASACAAQAVSAWPVSARIMVTRSSRARATRERMVPMGTSSVWAASSVGQAQLLGQHERGTTVVREGVDQGVQVAGACRVGDDPVTGTVGEQFPRTAALAPADLVRAGPASDGQQPRSCGRIRPESGGGTHGSDVGLLGQVVGRLAIDEVCTEAPHVRLGALDEGMQCQPVALAGLEQQVRQLIHGVRPAYVAEANWPCVELIGASSRRSPQTRSAHRLPPGPRPIRVTRTARTP
jgi:hypothetical protein